MAPTKKTVGTGILVAAGVGVAGYYLLKSSGVSLFGLGGSGSSASTSATSPYGKVIGYGSAVDVAKGDYVRQRITSSGEKINTVFNSQNQIVATYTFPAGQSTSSGNSSLQFYGWTTVQYGSQGIQVLDVQKALTALGYNPASNQDGIFGPITESSVKSFQSAKGISVDGIVGPQTYGQLNIALQQIGGFWKQS